LKIDTGDLNEHQEATPMTLAIQQRVRASPKALFEMVLDSGSTAQPPQLPRKSAENLVGHGAHLAVKSAA
jgi:hypothetical protein